MAFISIFVAYDFNTRFSKELSTHKVEVTSSKRNGYAARSSWLVSSVEIEPGKKVSLTCHECWQGDLITITKNKPLFYGDTTYKFIKIDTKWHDREISNEKASSSYNTEP